MDDGKGMWGLAKRTEVLDLNSAYSYLMLCQYFSDTCLLAEHNNRVAGFVTGFCPPNKPYTVFVWQIAVDVPYQGYGLGISLLTELLKNLSNKEIRYLETTITPSNQPSKALFTKLARSCGVDCAISTCFPESAFPFQNKHETELLYRIGPFDENNQGVDDNHNL